MVKPIPTGYHSLTPNITCNGAAQAIAWYGKVFDAQETVRMKAPGSDKILHAEIRIGDSILMLADSDHESKDPQALGGVAGALMLYTEDCDATFDRAVQAGATVLMPLTDMFWGDRFGRLRDPYGHVWAIATHKEDLSPAEMQKRQAEFMAQVARQPG